MKITWLEPSALCGEVVSVEAESDGIELVLAYADGRRLRIQPVGTYDVQELGITDEGRKAPPND